MIHGESVWPDVVRAGGCRGLRQHGLHRRLGRQLLVVLEITGSALAAGVPSALAGLATAFGAVAWRTWASAGTGPRRWRPGSSRQSSDVAWPLPPSCSPPFMAVRRQPGVRARQRSAPADPVRGCRHVRRRPPGVGAGPRGVGIHGGCGGAEPCRACRSAGGAHRRGSARPGGGIIGFLFGLAVVLALLAGLRRSARCRTGGRGADRLGRPSGLAPCCAIHTGVRRWRRCWAGRWPWS